ncbi:MAG: hypothetical protein ACRYGP_08670 [Janthinobacterium lividum]
MQDTTTDHRGSAVRWFALTAVALSVASLAGAHGLDWLSQPGRVALVAYRSPVPVRSQPVASDLGVDRMATGSIPASSALVIRIH